MHSTALMLKTKLTTTKNKNMCKNDHKKK